MCSHSYIPRQTLSIQMKKLKSSFEIRLNTFVFSVFFCCILMSLISLTVTTYTLCPLSTTKWLMCENGMNPRVPLSSKSNLQPRPKNNTLVLFRALLQNFWWTHPLLFWEYPPPSIPIMKSQTYLIEFSLWGKLFWLTDSPQCDPFLSVHYLLGFRLF